MSTFVIHDIPSSELSMVTRPCHVQKITFHSMLSHLLVLIFFLTPSSMMFLQPGRRELDKDAPLWLRTHSHLFSEL